MALKLRFFRILLVVLSLVGTLAHAEGSHDYGGGPVNPPPETLEQQQLRAIHEFRQISGSVPYALPQGGECEKILMQTSAQMGRPLTAKEIADTYPIILKATGEALIPMPGPGARLTWTIRPGSGCFTGEMKILTPSGERKMSDLKPGDEVISFDLVSQKPVVNIIHNKHVLPDRAYGRLKDLVRPIDVTHRHRFLAAGPERPLEFYAIEEIQATDQLMKFDVTKPLGQQIQGVPRGCYLPEGKATVYDLEMIGEPRNFIVEGVLVHNIKS